MARAKSKTPLANAVTRQVARVFIAYTEGRLAPIAPTLPAVPLAEVHGSRVGETTTVRAELVAWCKLAARSLGVTIHRVHGAIRRQYKVASAYHLSLNVWPMVRAFLESLATQRLFLDAPTRPALRLIAGGAQTSMPWAVEVANR